MKSIAKKTQSKESESCSIVEPKNTTLLSEQNQSTSCQAMESLTASASQSISENLPHQPQDPDAKVVDSDSQKIVETTTSAAMGKTKVTTVNSVGKDSEQKRSGFSDDSNGTKQVPNDEDITVQHDARTELHRGETPLLLQQQKSEMDIGLGTIGISTNILGLKIERQQQSTTEENNDHEDQQNNVQNIDASRKTTGRKSKKYGKTKSSRRSGGCDVPRIKPKYDCHVQSIGITSTGEENERVLDMYAYHLGREGMEARDADTGELLFTQQVTDTNHEFDAPKTTFRMVVEFPLEDEEDEFDDYTKQCDDDGTKDRKGQNKVDLNPSKNSHNNFISGSRGDSIGRLSKKKGVAMYRETLDWDLLDPKTPTPLAFATSLGEEYGLSFGQTMDLAAQMDKQIENHITETNNYREPIVAKEITKDLTQIRKIGPIRQAYRYDEVIQTEEGGTLKAKRESRGHLKSRHSVAAGGSRQNRKGGNLHSDTASKVTASGKRKNNKNNKHRSAIQNSSEVNLEDEFVDELMEEVKKRSIAESNAEVVKNGNGGVLKSEKNAICHICKKRVDEGFHFPCSTNNHVYCELHVKVSV